MKRFLVTFCCILGISAVQAQTTVKISSSTKVLNNGAKFNVPSGFFVNDGSYTDTTSPGAFNVGGGVTFSGTGTTTLYDLNFLNTGSSLLNSLVSVYNTTTVAPGASLDANSNLWIRSDLKAGANLVVHGTITDPVLGLNTMATVTPGCPGYTSDLSLNMSGTVVTYQWQNSPDDATWSDVTGATNAVYTATVTASIYYRCYVTTTNSPFVGTSASVQLVMWPSPAVTATGNLMCEGYAPVAISASGASTYSWSPASYLSTTTGATVYANPPADATYTVVGTDIHGCTNTATAIVTVNPTPSAIGGQLLICNGGTTTLTNTVPGGMWMSGNAFVATVGSTSGVVTSVAPGVVYITYMMPCGSYVNAQVTVNPTPTAAPSNDGAICIGGTVNLAANPAGGANSFSWTGPDLSSSMAMNPSATPTMTVTYSVTVSSGMQPGCSPSTVYTTDVTVNAKPVAAPANDGPICIDGTAHLTANASGGVGPYIYTWTEPSLFTTTEANPSVTPFATTSYSVTVSNAASGCSSGIAYPTTVVVNPKPTLAPSNDGTICIGGTVNLAANPADGVGAYIYSWTGPDMSSLTDANPSATPTMTVTYSVTVSNTASGCSSGIIYTTTANVIAVPTAAPSNDGTICVGGTVNLAANPAGGIGAYFYSWSGPSLSSASVATPTATPGSTVSYSLTVSNAASGCVSSEYTTLVTVNAKPTAAPANDGPICVGGTVNLTSNPADGTGPYIYSWSGPGLSSTTAANPSGVMTVSGTYSLLITNAASGCSSGISYTTDVDVYAKPTASPVNDGAICVGGTVNLTANPAAGYGSYMYSWSGPSLSTTTDANPSAMPTGTVMYSLVVSNTASGCVSTPYTTYVVVNAKPTLAPANDGPICIDGTVNLMANPADGVGSYIYSWTGPDMSSTTDANPSATPTMTVTYSVTVSNTASGCSSGIIYTTDVTVNDKPIAAPTQSGPICLGDMVHLMANATGGVGDFMYHWSGLALAATNIANPSAAPGTSTVYSLTVSNAASGCSSGIVYVDSVHVDTLYTPVVLITGHSSIKAGQNDTLRAVVTNGGPGLTYQWVVNATHIAGATTAVYISNAFANGDSVTCYVSSHSPCGSVTTPKSVVITINNLAVNTVGSAVGEITLVPNPNKGVFTLSGKLFDADTQNANVTITNMLGQTIYSESVPVQNGGLNKLIQLSNGLSSGMYMLNLNAGGQNQVFRFVVQQ